jgi:cob(I)alamin adenosyltransferase
MVIGIEFWMKDSTRLVDSIETGNTLGTEEVSRILMKIYTKTGDAGQTGLFGGPRVTKDHARIEAFGTVDELNSHLGMARAQPSANLFDELLRVIQCDLFELGAELATPGDHDERIKVCQVQALENAIDKYEEDLEPLASFILPTGSPLAASLHVARTVCRRAERRVVTLAGRLETTVPANAIEYLNRLGDLLFVLARTVNKQAHVVDDPWHPS